MNTTFIAVMHALLGRLNRGTRGCLTLLTQCFFLLATFGVSFTAVYGFTTLRHHHDLTPHESMGYMLLVGALSLAWCCFDFYRSKPIQTNLSWTKPGHSMVIFFSAPFLLWVERVRFTMNAGPISSTLSANHDPIFFFGHDTLSNAVWSLQPFQSPLSYKDLGRVFFKSLIRSPLWSLSWFLAFFSLIAATALIPLVLLEKLIHFLIQCCQPQTTLPHSSLSGKAKAWVSKLAAEGAEQAAHHEKRVLEHHLAPPSKQISVDKCRL